MQNRLTYQNLIALEQSHAELVSRITPDGTFIFDETTTQYEFVSLANAVGLPDDEQKAYKPHTLKRIEFHKPQPNLRYLDVSYCDLTLVDIGNCPNLQILYANNSNIKSIRFSGQFDKLEFINLDRNGLQSLLLHSKDVPKLKYLYLYDNNLSSFGGMSEFFAKKDNDFNIDKNLNIQYPPLPIVEAGKESIRSYFQSIVKRGKENIFEVKLLVLGEGAAGKTTFTDRIAPKNEQLRKAEEIKSTVRIEYSPWSPTFEYNGEIRTMSVNIWDLAGQIPYRGTHQLFFEKSSFYVYVINGRKENTATDLDHVYWLDTILELAGDDSKVMVVGNIYENQKPTFDWKDWQKQFPIIVDYFEMDLLNDISKISELQKKIKTHLQNLQGFDQLISKSWVSFRNEIREEGKLKRYIPFERYQTLSEPFVETKDLNVVSNYFSRIGVFKHYWDDEFLSDIVYLDMDWLLENIYLILNADISKKIKHGRLSSKDIESIWNNNEFVRMRKYFERLMKKYGLMYRAENNNDLYIVPGHLELADLPATKYNTEPDVLQFIYEFPYNIPYGVTIRLIVALSEYIKDSDKVWRNKVILEYEQTEAVISEYANERIIEVQISGFNKVGLQTIINFVFQQIVADYKNHKPEILLPCICEQCKKAILIGGKIHLHKFSTLQNYRNKGKNEVTCDESVIDVSVKELLEGVNFSTKFDDNSKIIGEVRNLENKIERLTKTVEESPKNIVVNVEQNNNQSVSQDVKVEVKVDISFEIKDLISHFENLKEDLSDDRKLLKQHLNDAEIDAAISDIEKAEQALKIISAAKDKNEEIPIKSKNKFKNFIDELANENSLTNKTLKVFRKGKNYAQKLIESYNKIAKDIGFNPLAEEAMKFIQNF